MVLVLILQMMLVLFNAFIAGELYGSIKTDRLEGVAVTWKPYILMWCNLLAAAFNIVSIYGQGLTHGQLN